MSKQCSVHGCESVSRRWGLCEPHSRLERKRRRETSREKCRHDSCNGKPVTAGLCNSHYEQLRSSRASQCSVDGCVAPGVRIGLCHRHYDRHVNHGDVNAYFGGKHAEDKIWHDLTSVLGCWAVELTHGKWALIDACDVERVRQYPWIASRRRGGDAWYAKARACGLGWLNLGRFILGCDDGFECDHISRNPLDNRRINIRVVTRTQNIWNRGRQRSNTSGYPGVIWHKKQRKWNAVIATHGKRIHLGCFNVKDDAVAARKAATIKHHGEFACEC